MITQRFICIALNAALCVSVAGLTGCNQQPSAATAPLANASSTAPTPASTAAQAAPYTPPSADDLYQMVAPIALFPDKLVAQVLAGSTYPDQVTAADNFLAQNQNLQGPALQDQVDPQAWDPSIKGLTAFPKVLDQMAQNLPWTTALGAAYVNDPTDVLNAIQVMRQRATKHGSLHSSAKMRVVDAPVAQAASYDPSADDYPPVYSGPSVVPAPEQSIEILPAQDDTVYVPSYDPQTVYGEQISDYPGYSYQQPVYEEQSRGYSGSQMVTAGAISFGVGILVGALLEHSHHDSRPSYGWNSWGMNWGGGRDGDRGDDGGRRGDWQRPAVVHNNTTYVSRSTTIVNHYVTNNINNSVNNSNNVTNSNNRNVDNRDTNAGNNPNANAMVRLPAPANRGTAMAPMVPPRGGNRPAEAAPSRAVMARTPVTRPDFGGALSKGEPARFSHLDARNQTSTLMPRGTTMTSMGLPLAGKHPNETVPPHVADVRPPASLTSIDARTRERAAARVDRSGVKLNTPTHVPDFGRGGQRPSPSAPQSHLAPRIGTFDQLGSTKAVGQEERQPPSRVMPKSHLAPRVESVFQREATGAEPAHQSVPHATLPAVQEIRHATPVERPAFERTQPEPTTQQMHPQPVERPAFERRAQPQPTIEQVHAQPVERTAPVMEAPRAAPRQEAPMQPRREAPAQPPQEMPAYRPQPRPEATRQAPAARPAAAPEKKEPSKKDEKKADSGH